MTSIYHPLLAPHVGRDSFEAADIRVLAETTKAFRTLRTTPHVLTEVSNLANQLPENIKRDWFNHFSRRVRLIDEQWIPVTVAADEPTIALGLTDAVLTFLARTHVILTIDFPLSNSLESRGLRVINFTHLRNF